VTQTSLVNSPQDTGLAKTGKEISMPAMLAAIPAVSAFIARHGITKAVKKYGQAAVDKAIKAGAKVNRKVDDALDKAQGVTKNTPGRKSAKDGITVGKKRTQADRRTQRVKGAAVGSGVTAAGMSGNDYTAANVDLKSAKGLPVADMSQSIDVKGDEDGMRYFQNGKEVRMPK
jgi:hypothetical protein